MEANRKPVLLAYYHINRGANHEDDRRPAGTKSDKRAAEYTTEEFAIENANAETIEAEKPRDAKPKSKSNSTTGKTGDKNQRDRQLASSIYYKHTTQVIYEEERCRDISPFLSSRKYST